MDNLRRASVTLHIQDDDLVPEELTALLGREPDRAVRKGETFTSAAQPARMVTAHTGMWSVGTGYRQPPNIDQQIIDLLDSLPESPDIWRDLCARFKCHVSVGAYFVNDSWTGGILLKPQTLSMLGDRSLAIDFDMYAPGASPDPRR